MFRGKCQADRAPSCKMIPFWSIICSNCHFVSFFKSSTFPRDYRIPSQNNISIFFLCRRHIVAVIYFKFIDAGSPFIPKFCCLHLHITAGNIGQVKFLFIIVSSAGCSCRMVRYFGECSTVAGDLNRIRFRSMLPRNTDISQVLYIAQVHLEPRLRGLVDRSGCPTGRHQAIYGACGTVIGTLCVGRLSRFPDSQMVNSFLIAQTVRLERQIQETDRSSFQSLAV